MDHRLLLAFGSVAALGFGISSSASAQQDVPVVEQAPAPQAPPAGYEPQQPLPPAPTYAPAPPTAAAYAPAPRAQRIPYVEGMVVPPGAAIIDRRRLGMLIPGVVLFGVFYIGSVASWAISKDGAGCIQDEILIPVVGPFLAAVGAETQARRVGAAFTGVVETLGLALFVAGLVPKRYLVSYAGDLRITPHAGASGGRLDLSLHF